MADEALQETSGLQASELDEHIERLRGLGFAIESSPGVGHRLTRRFDDLLVPEAVLALLLGEMDLGLPWLAGVPYRYLRRCSSTNQVLKEEAARSPAGTAVVTDEQTGGRGRLNRFWVSDPGRDLTFSVLLQPPTAARGPVLSLAAALAVAEVLEEIPGLAGRVGVKWPNDVLLGAKKVCGILLESCLAGDRVQSVVAGIGLNVNSDVSAMVGRLAGAHAEEWRGRTEPTSLSLELGRPLARGALLARLLTRLTQRWLEPEVADLLDGLKTLDRLRGRSVEIASGRPGDEVIVAGEAVGLGPDGQLLVRNREGTTVAVFAGEVTVRTGS